MSGGVVIGSAVETQGLWKFFGMVPALRNVNLQVSYGERVGILGHNGAGKTTLLRVLGGLARPTRGNVLIGGDDPWTDGAAAHRNLGALLHQPLLYTDLTAAENLHFYGRLYGLTDLKERVPAALEQVGLANKSSQLVRNFSRGMQQRLALARALLHNPKLLLLDEPDTGLDVHALSALQNVITQGNQTVVLTTHNLERALAVADRLILMVSGRVASTVKTDGMTVQELKELYEHLPRAQN